MITERKFMKNSKELVFNLIVAGVFFAIGFLTPGSSLMSTDGFASNVSGIATGAGIAWLIKTLIDGKKGSKQS